MYCVPCGPGPWLPWLLFVGVVGVPCSLVLDVDVLVLDVAVLAGVAGATRLLVHGATWCMVLRWCKACELVISMSCATRVMLCLVVGVMRGSWTVVLHAVFQVPGRPIDFDGIGLQFSMLTGKASSSMDAATRVIA